METTFKFILPSQNLNEKNLATLFRKKGGEPSGPSYFMVGFSIQTCCGNETCVVISARLQQN